MDHSRLARSFLELRTFPREMGRRWLVRRAKQAWEIQCVYTGLSKYQQERYADVAATLLSRTHTHTHTHTHTEEPENRPLPEDRTAQVLNCSCVLSVITYSTLQRSCLSKAEQHPRSNSRRWTGYTPTEANSKGRGKKRKQLSRENLWDRRWMCIYVASS